MRNFPNTLTTSSKQEVRLDNKRLLLAFKQPTTKKDISSALKEVNLVLEEGNEKDKHNHWHQINHTATRFWVKTADNKAITNELFSAIEKTLKGKLEWIGPVYAASQDENIETRFCPLPNVLLFEKAEKLQRSQDEIIKQYALNEVTEKSKYLSKYRYLQVSNIAKINAYELQQNLQKAVGVTGAIRFENMPMVRPLAATIPDDTLWANQWNMTQINAPNAWDISTGTNTTVICVLDEGCDLTHPDLQFSEDGINLGTMMPTGAPTGNHGTACAGIAAATFNNAEGVAGVAGNCLIMPVAFNSWSDVEVANGINYATTNGAAVISMSFGWNAWDPAIIDPEIQNAFNNDVLMCTATHNHNGAITYPATNPLVLAIGASSTDDNRKSPTSPDGEGWGSNFGDVTYAGILTGVSVVAPGVLIPTTDIQGDAGYNVNNGAAGNYFNTFNGTSAATPHVAGLAALIRSQYPTLTNVQVRAIIERTAAKVGSLAYAETPNFLNGTRNQEMGYGRIDTFRSLDFADVMIKDWSGDDGREPSTPPSNNWWSYSDIVVRIFDDNVFNPNDPAQSKNVERGQTNYMYVRVTNNGPHEARNVVVDFRITPYVGLEFVYPNDWALEDGMHVKPTPVVATFATIASGASAMAKFTISAAQTETLYGWQYANPWHPCLLARVTSDNDYAFANADLSSGNLFLKKNNIAQRNLSVIDVLANATETRAISSPFVAGNYANKQRKITVNIDRSKLPSNARVHLSVDDDGSAFPSVNFLQALDDQNTTDFSGGCGRDQLVFMSKTKVKTRFGCSDAVLTLEKGSVFEFTCSKEKTSISHITGGSLILEDGKRLIQITDNKTSVTFDKLPGQLFPMSVNVLLPSNLAKQTQYSLSISQLDENRQLVGGADTVYNII